MLSKQRLNDYIQAPKPGAQHPAPPGDQCKGTDSFTPQMAASTCFAQAKLIRWEKQIGGSRGPGLGLGGWNTDGKGAGGVLWGDGNVLYLDGGGYLDVDLCQNPKRTLSMGVFYYM